MKYWQKQRNYRKYGNADGTVTYIITVDGQDVEVSAEVYLAYSQADRRERYMAEQEEGLLLSLERMAEDEMQLSYLTDRHHESAEDTAVMSILSGQAMSALGCLSPEEQHLIDALVLDGVTEREYAQLIGMSQKGVNKRKKRILQKLCDLLVLNPSKFRDGQ